MALRQPATRLEFNLWLTAVCLVGLTTLYAGICARSDALLALLLVVFLLCGIRLRRSGHAFVLSVRFQPVIYTMAFFAIGLLGSGTSTQVGPVLWWQPVLGLVIWVLWAFLVLGVNAVVSMLPLCAFHFFWAGRPTSSFALLLSDGFVWCANIEVDAEDYVKCEVEWEFGTDTFHLAPDGEAWFLHERGDSLYIGRGIQWVNSVVTVVSPPQPA